MKVSQYRTHAVIGESFDEKNEGEFLHFNCFEH